MLLATPLLAANNPTESVAPPFLRNSRTNAAVGRGELEAGAASARESAQALPRPRARSRRRRAHPSGLAGRRAGSPQLPSWRGGGRRGSVWNVPLAEPGDSLVRRSIHEVSPPSHTEIRSPVARRHPSRRSPRPPERGAVARAGAGNSRGLSGWRSPSGARGPAFLLPGPGGGVRRREGLAARVGGGAAAASAAELRGRRAAAPPQPPGEPRAPQRAPARGPRPLAVPASFPHTPPGPPGPQAFPALLLPLSKLRCEPAAAAVRLPRCLRGDFSSSGSPFTHRHTHARERARALARWAAPFSPALLTLTLTIL